MKGWKSRTLQLAKSSHRINALMNEAPPPGGFLFNRRRKLINRNRDAVNGGLGVDPEEDEKIKLYVSPQVRLYRLEGIIEAAINRKLDEDADNRFYDPVRAKLMCQALSKDIRGKVKELDLKRFRVVCIVSIIEKRLQSLEYKMAFCMDAIDYFGNVKFECGAQFYIVATVYLVFKD